MGVYIKGMEMPKSCALCGLRVFNGICDRCVPEQMTLHGWEYHEGFPEYCPLIEVTEPHGRLIDVDEHFREIKSHWCAGCVNYPKGCAFCKVTVYEDMMDAPTVIEAEGE